MTVTKERQMNFKTPLGHAFVWGLVNSLTHGIGGWHFVLRGTDGLENYYSEDGRVFSIASVQSPCLMLHTEETDTEKVRLLRKLWEEYIMRLDLYATDYPDVVTVS
jgi:hypothetical protein